MIAFLHIFATLAVCALVGLTVRIHLNVTKGNRLIMSVQDDLTSAAASVKTTGDALIALVGTLNTSISNLNSTVANLTAQIQQNRTQIDPLVVQAAVDSINAEVAAMKAALPVAQVPTGAMP